MANRAYLFATEDPHRWCCERERDAYFDSRWTIPVAWWFLFSPDDVQRLRLEHDEEVRLRAPREAALDRFMTARPGLNELIGGLIEGRRVDSFLATLHAWSGYYLVMDPSEVCAGAGPVDAAALEARLRTIVGLAGEQPFGPDAFKAEARSLSSLDGVTPEAVEVSYLGCTYGVPYGPSR